MRAAVLLDLLLQRLRVPRKRGLEVAVDVERNRERGERDDDAEDLPDPVCVRTERGHPGAAAERHDEHGNRRSGRVGQGQHDRAGADVLRRPDDRDRSENRARAGHEHETEAGAEQEPAAEVAARRVW